jgi:hypothetical protein
MPVSPDRKRVRNDNERPTATTGHLELNENKNAGQGLSVGSDI